MGTKGKTWKLSEETKRKIGDANKISVKKLWGNPEYRAHMSEVHKGKIHEGSFKKGHTLRNTGKTQFKKGQIGTRLGQKNSEEHRRKSSLARKGKPNFKMRGENHPHWKGGVTSFIKKVRHCLRYREWRSDVFTRDNFECQLCYSRGGKLHADHIKPFSIIIRENKVVSFDEAMLCEELWNLNNGRTLCVQCHEKTDTYGGKTK